MESGTRTDAELVVSALTGWRDAFRELVTRFERPIYSLVLRMVQDPGVAEDLAQEVFVKAFRRLATYDPQWKFSSWLFKMAHKTTIAHLRRGAPETVPLEAEARAPPRAPGLPGGGADVLCPRRLVPGDLRGDRPAAGHSEDQPPPGEEGARRNQERRP